MVSEKAELWRRNSNVRAVEEYRPLAAGETVDRKAGRRGKNKIVERIALVPACVAAIIVFRINKS